MIMRDIYLKCKLLFLLPFHHRVVYVAIFLIIFVRSWSSSRWNQQKVLQIPRCAGFAFLTKLTAYLLPLIIKLK